MVFYSKGPSDFLPEGPLLVFLKVLPQPYTVTTVFMPFCSAAALKAASSALVGVG